MGAEFLKLDHTGIVVTDIHAAIERYHSDFGVELLLREIVPSQETEVAFLKLPAATIELLAPLSPTSPLHKFLKIRGQGIHHVCYEVANVAETLAHLKARGYQLIDETPRPGARNSEIAFIHPRSCDGVLTEICAYSGQ